MPGINWIVQKFSINGRWGSPPDIARKKNHSIFRVSCYCSVRWILLTFVIVFSLSHAAWRYFEIYMLLLDLSLGFMFRLHHSQLSRSCIFHPSLSLVAGSYLYSPSWPRIEIEITRLICSLLWSARLSLLKSTKSGSVFTHWVFFSLIFSSQYCYMAWLDRFKIRWNRNHSSDTLLLQLSMLEARP